MNTALEMDVLRRWFHGHLFALPVICATPRMLPGLLHLMRAVVASRIMRTTIDLDATVVKELKRRSKSAGKSMGQLASELLATSLKEHAGRPRKPDGLAWIAKDLGRPLVDLEDKEAVRALFDARR